MSDIDVYISLLENAQFVYRNFIIDGFVDEDTYNKSPYLKETIYKFMKNKLIKRNWQMTISNMNTNAND